MYKKIIIILAIISLLTIGSSVYALEANYPFLPIIGTITNDSGLGEYVTYFFGLAMYLAGALAVISFTIGAVQVIMSASSPETANNGKDRMKGALLGLVLTLSAFVILQTINPNFTSPSLTPLPGVAGIYYFNGDLENLKPAPSAEPNTAISEVITSGYNQIYYKCTEGTDPLDVPPLLVWIFPQPNFQGNDENYSGASFVSLQCNDFLVIDGVASFKMAYQTPGIYYFLQEDCSGYMSNSNKTTQDRIPEPFTGKIKSVWIVNDFDDGNYYGAIFHSSPGATKASDCTNPVLTTGCSNLSNYSFIGFNPYSVEIFNHVLDPDVSSGDGVWFFGNVNGWDSSNKSGLKKVKPDLIGTYFMQPANSDYLKFDYAGVPTDLGEVCRKEPSCREEPDVACCNCATPKDWADKEETKCGGSIRFGGEYLVTLYTDYPEKITNAAGEEIDVLKHYCQSFKKDVPNLGTSGNFLPHPDTELTRINIIPIQ